MNKMIVIISLFYIYYNLGGLATTNILRLTKGNELPVNASNCVCESCGKNIPPLLQLPIVSYVICKGKCRNCNAKIPIYPLILEITIILGMSVLTYLFHYSFYGVAASFLFYELVRIVIVFFIRGKRENDFVKQYVIAILSMVPFFMASAFVVFLYSIV